MATIAENWMSVQKRIGDACQASGRDPQEITVVAVSKTVGKEQIVRAWDAGIRVFGENRVQEAQAKADQIDKPIVWHMVGHLQTNKVKTVLDFVSVIESVDSFRLAREIDKRAQKAVEIFIQVNTSDEKSKYGCEPADTLALVEQIATLPHVRITGLMTIGAFLPDPEEVRPCFQRLARLKDEINAAHIAGVEINHLSMGMSNDFQVAIEEGATQVRLGRILFGERPQM
ncbi:YggS family pyridoxal phosphate-dependent enzyme [candidate division KSB1 bacterium]|nr:YggS family pyridoxal phosphate-dependent enzyme [candidate division KSB1 bacterium]